MGRCVVADGPCGARRTARCTTLGIARGRCSSRNSTRCRWRRWPEQPCGERSRARAAGALAAAGAGHPVGARRVGAHAGTRAPRAPRHPVGRRRRHRTRGVARVPRSHPAEGRAGRSPPPPCVGAHACRSAHRRGRALAAGRARRPRVRCAGVEWIVPFALALPLFAVELWFDARSRGRRLVPELCGALGITAAVAAIVVAGGDSARLACALWIVLAARAVASVPFARVQVLRLKTGVAPRRTSDLAQGAGVVLAIAAWSVDASVALGACCVLLVAAAQFAWSRARGAPGGGRRRLAAPVRARGRGRDRHRGGDRMSDGGDPACWSHLFDDRHDLATRRDVESLVRRFYRAAAMDDVLGPVFTAAHMSWPDHLGTVTDFWMWQLFGVRGYEGNPLPRTDRRTRVRRSPTHTSSAGSRCSPRRSTSSSRVRSRSSPRPGPARWRTH